MACEFLGKMGAAVVAGGIAGSAQGAIGSLYSWVGVSTVTLAWVGAPGCVCGVIAAAGMAAILRCLGIEGELAKNIVTITLFVTQLIVTGAILVGMGMTAGAAFTAAASILIVPVAVVVVGLFVLYLMGGLSRGPHVEEL